MSSGGYEGSCRDCHLLVETHRWMNLTCNCFDISDDLIPSQYDLSKFNPRVPSLFLFPSIFELALLRLDIIPWPADSQ